MEIPGSVHVPINHVTPHYNTPLVTLQAVLWWLGSQKDQPLYFRLANPAGRRISWDEPVASAVYNMVEEVRIAYLMLKQSHLRHGNKCLKISTLPGRRPYLIRIILIIGSSTFFVLGIF